jgi:hypothetical protein
MASARWEPFRGLLAWQDRMNHLYGDAARTCRGDQGEEMTAGQRTPAVEQWWAGSRVGQRRQEQAYTR